MLNFLLLFLVLISCPWFWFFWQKQQYFELITAIAVSALLLLQKNINSGRKFLILLIPSLIILWNINLPLIISSHDESIIYQINVRRSFHPNVFTGRLLENKVMEYWNSYEENIFHGIDLNYYFFASHPRERIGINEHEIFIWFSLPFFIAGSLDLLRQKKYFGYLYFIYILIFISLFTSFDKFTFLVFPFFVFNIHQGLNLSFEKLRRKR